ncbi:MAG: RsmB/NOP family class I SAM-dependent RNA methyltransferase [Cloacibacillus sp.]
MRGLEAALSIYGEVRGGAFASEALRKVYTNIAPNDRTLAATLVYCTLRRQALWKTMLVKFCKRNARDLPELTTNALMVGIAGIMELKHFALPVLINGIVQAIKNNGDERDIGLVNAVLHTVADEGVKFMENLSKSSALRDQALYWGVPGWAAAQWSKELSIAEAKKLVRGSGMRTYLSLRLSSGVDREKYIEEYNATGRKAWASPFLEYSVRTAANPYPVDLPGFGEGRIMPQSESSMLIAEQLAKRRQEGLVLDMCCGRGVKTGQLADLMPEAKIEAWDLSEGKLKSARFEMMRLHAEDRVKFKHGDALLLEPDEAPSMILLDAPCTGSGTWGRHPESKWRCTPEQAEENSKLQKQLLERAVEMLKPGGVIAYSTCSLFRDENEKVAADIIGRHPEIVELPIGRTAKFMQKGKPYGTIIMPALPWVDGFYMALLSKRK